MSHGRGGAGNIGVGAAAAAATGQPELKDLTTPTIKSSTYTTGRGGTGNMAKNDASNPERARAAQDVEAPLHHDKPAQGTFHWGRGGEGNMLTLGKSGAEEARERSATRKLGRDEKKEKDRESSAMAGVLSRPENKQRRTGSFSNAIVERGREALGLVRKNTDREKGKEKEKEKNGAVAAPVTIEAEEKKRPEIGAGDSAIAAD